MRRTVFLSLFVLVVSTFAVRPQVVIRVEEPVRSSRLAGVVIASDNEPVPGAKVELMSPDWKRVIRTRNTDHNGLFNFRVSKRGTYQLRIWHMGFQVMEYQIQVSSSGKRKPRFMLEIGT